MKSKIVEVRKEIKEAFEAKVVECVNRCRAKANGKLIPIPKLVFRRCGSRAGLCQTDLLEGSTVYINPDFFVKNYDEQLNVTLPHEVAHAVVDALWRGGRQKVRDHGWQWAMVMRWMDLEPDRCHKMDMEHVQTRTVERPFKYVCGCADPHMLTLRMHEKIQVHGKHLRCKLCHKRIVYYRQATGELRPLVPQPNPVRMPVVKAPLPVVKIETPPTPPATHKTVTVFEGGMLVNKRVPLT